MHFMPVGAADATQPLDVVEASYRESIAPEWHQKVCGC
jgi:hypothetical protein